VGAAVTGLNDWAELDSKPRRLGLFHGLLNLSATALFAGSLVARRQRSRSVGRGLAVLGYLVATTAAKLGGTLVYEERIGTDRSREKELPAKYTPVIDEAELEEGVARCVEANGTPIVLVKHEGRILALADTCSHLGGPLSEGKVDGCIIQCPWHGSRFSLETGAVIDGPAVHPQTRVETRVRSGKVEVRHPKEI
jgi:nitrite reductase/ring-hydroxylating ferredoxin subunit